MAAIYIIGGCNGAGKTTSANEILPKYSDCREFVNADSIAKGLSPFQPETVSFQAGRIMLNRMKELIAEKETFAFETTLPAKNYLNILQVAKKEKIQDRLILFLDKFPKTCPCKDRRQGKNRRV